NEDHQQFVLLKRLIPFFCLHISLLLRLSIVDRHLISFPTVIFSSTVSKLLSSFQKLLATVVSNLRLSSLTTLSFNKISDMFDGRLFAFTVHSINSNNSHFSIDCETSNIFRQSLHLIDESETTTATPPLEKLLNENLKQLILSGDIKCSSEASSLSTIINLRNSKRKLSKISNPFIDEYLKPILSATDANIDFMDTPNSSHTQYEDIKDNQLQIVLPSSSTVDSTEKQKQEKKAKYSTKAQKIVEDNIKRQADIKIQEEDEQMLRITNMLKTIPKNNYFDLIKILDSNLQSRSSCIQTSTNRLKLLTLKMKYQRKYLQLLLTTTDNKNKNILEQLRIEYFATLTSITDLEKITNPFKEKKKI
ncbi:unnamed protein product, partial [Didymodactylos carnosus]